MACVYIHDDDSVGHFTRLLPIAFACHFIADVHHLCTDVGNRELLLSALVMLES